MDAGWFGALGAAGSALLAASGYLYKLRRERQRTARAALYHLLELNHRVVRVHEAVGAMPSDFLVLFERSLLRHGVSLDEAVRQQLSGMVGKLVRATMEVQLDDLRETIGVPLEKVLDELAKDDPFLAFTLKGRDALARVLQPMDKLRDHGRLAEFATILEGTQAIKDIVSDLLREFSTEEIRKAVLDTAMSVGVLTWLRCRYFLRSNYSNRRQELLKQFIDSLVEKMLPELKGAYASPTGGAQSGRQPSSGLGPVDLGRDGEFVRATWSPGQRPS